MYKRAGRLAHLGTPINLVGSTKPSNPSVKSRKRRAKKQDQTPVKVKDARDSSAALRNIIKSRRRHPITNDLSKVGDVDMLYRESLTSHVIQVIPSLPKDCADRLDRKMRRRDYLGIAKIVNHLNISPAKIRHSIFRLMNVMYNQRRYNELLVAYHLYGQLTDHPVDVIIQKIFEIPDYPSFLKQALRYNMQTAMKEQIDIALAWHVTHGRNDAIAWQKKFSRTSTKNGINQVAQQSPSPYSSSGAGSESGEA